MQVTFNGKIQTPYYKPHISNNTQKALTTTGAWFAFGVGLDFVGRKCHPFKSATKNSVLINSIISLSAGLVTYFTAQKASEKSD